jgi:hypothetical protein
MHKLWQRARSLVRIGDKSRQLYGAALEVSGPDGTTHLLAERCAGCAEAALAVLRVPDPVQLHRLAQSMARVEVMLERMGAVPGVREVMNRYRRKEVEELREAVYGPKEKGKSEQKAG